MWDKSTFIVVSLGGILPFSLKQAAIINDRNNIPFGSWTVFVLVCVGAWTLYVLTASFTGYLDDVATNPEASLSTLVNRYARATWPLVIVTLIVFAWTGHLAARGKTIRQIMASTVLLVIAIAVVYVPVEATLIAMNSGRPIVNILSSIRAVSPFSWFWDFTLLLIVIGTAYAWIYYRSFELEKDRSIELAINNERLAADLVRLELDQLRAQLEPHFLFNALNSISGLIRSGNEEGAAEALAELSELLRYAVESGNSMTVTIGRELSAAEDYLRLQKLRFGDRIRYEIKSNLQASNIQVPPMLLHPLIENAVQHGLTGASTPVEIRLKVLCDGDALQIYVRNTMPGKASTPVSGFGVGLSNTKRRLECLYADRFQLTTFSEDGEFVAQLELPVTDLD